MKNKNYRVRVLSRWEHQIWRIVKFYCLLYQYDIHKI